MWNGQSWQMCGTPRHSEQEAEQYVSQKYQGPEAASAYRLVYAFADHDVVRVWGTRRFARSNFERPAAPGH